MSIANSGFGTILGSLSGNVGYYNRSGVTSVIGQPIQIESPTRTAIALGYACSGFNTMTVMLSGLNATNSDSFGKVWASLTTVDTTHTLSIYKDSTGGLSNLVASGSISGNGIIILTEENGSGLTGALALMYSSDFALDPSPSVGSFIVYPWSYAYALTTAKVHGSVIEAGKTEGSLTGIALLGKEVDVLMGAMMDSYFAPGILIDYNMSADTWTSSMSGGGSGVLLKGVYVPSGGKVLGRALIY